MSLPFAPTTPRTLASEAPGPIVIEGFNPPDLAIGAHAATAHGADDYRAPICILQADPIEFLAGCAVAPDLSLLADPRVHIFLGPDGSRALEWFCGARLDTTLPKVLLRAPTLRTPLNPTPESILSGAHQAQLGEHNALRAAMSARPRRVEHWADRFGSGAPLRILIPTTRYSTYVRHAARDLGDALRALGHEPHLLEEPTTDSKLASVAYLRAARDTNPDLIVAINYVRAQLKSALPDDVPFVCWVQDRMPHLFDRTLGAAQTPLDFCAGHIHPSLYLDFAYPRANTLFRAVPASPRTFHDGPVDPARARELACEVLYAGHQSESPDTLRDRLLPAFAGVANLVDAARDIDAHLRALASRNELTSTSLDTLTRDALAARSIPLANPRAVEAFDATYTRTLAERILRHQALAWAADICARRGWRMQLCGNGWSSHPTLARFARPALAHDDDLRGAYRCARASIHASLASNAHQRIAECAMSGGLMLRRAPSPDSMLIRKLAVRAALESWGPGEPYAARSTTCFRWTRNLADDAASPDWNHPHIIRLRAAKGGERPTPNADGTYTTEINATLHDLERDIPKLPDIPLWTFPDYAYPRADESSFRTPEQLERVLERAVADDAWRAHTIAAHAAIARECWSTDRFARDLLGFLGESLSGASLSTADASAGAAA